MRTVLLSLLVVCNAVSLHAQQLHINDYRDVFSECIETSPRYPGGTTALNKYYCEKIKKAIRKGIVSDTITGDAVIAFKINAKGNVEWAKVVKSIDHVVDSVLVSIVCTTGKWAPATLNGKKVASHRRQPFIFCGADSGCGKSGYQCQ